MDALLEFLHMIAKKFIVWLVASQITWMNGAATTGATNGAATAPATLATDNQIISVIVLDVLIVYVLSPIFTRNKGKRIESFMIALVIWIVLRMTFEALGGAK